MTRCVGIRGATTVDQDSLEEVLDATQDLLARLQELNGFSPDDLASIVFTTSADIRSTFPARAARRLGWTQVPMLCAQEIDAPEALARCVRVLIHWNADTTPAEVRHAYKKLIKVLHPDMNGGDRSQEEQLQLVVWAWDQIKVSRNFKD